VSAETSAQPKPDQQATPSETTDYSLSEVRIAAMADLAPKLKEAELRLILELSRRQLTSPGAVRASGRELANACKMGRRNVQYALDALAKRNLITLRQGTATTAAIYRVNIFDTVPMGGVVTTPPPPTQGWLGGVEATPPLASLRRHPGDVTTPPPTENTALAAAAASLDLDEASLRLIDRVYSSKLQDHHPDDLAAIQQRLYGYFRKFGRGDDGRPIANPHPPDPHVAATLLAIAELNRLETMLDNLELDAMATKAYLPSTKSSLNPYSYGWFSIIALSRIHGIHFHKTKKARAALRDVKRKPRQPQPEQIDLPDIAALAKQKAMR
jgi:DNA-binding transcriptional ArsR family regulator